MPPIVEGQTFPNLLAFKESLRQWAIENNFTPAILDSDKQRVRAGCRSAPDCPFRIRINYSAKQGVAKVGTCEDSHSHPLGQDVSQNIKRPETGKMKFLVEVLPKLIEVGSNTTCHEICAAVSKKYGQEISNRQAQKVKRLLVKKPCGHCKQRGHSRKFCPNRSVSQEGDEDDGEDDEDMSGNEQPRRKSRCHVCYKTGHNRKNCPDKDLAVVPPDTPVAEQTSEQLHNQQQQSAYAPAQPPDGTDYVNHDPHNSDETDAGPATQLQLSLPPTSQHSAPVVPINFQPSMYTGFQPPMPYSMSHPTSQSMPQALTTAHARHSNDLRIRASELIRQAANLTQEAAKLNLEAARLIALIPP